MNISIVGFGFVGQAVYHIIKDKSLISIYDINISEYNDINVINNSEIIFICLPTLNNPDNTQDTIAFKKLFSHLEKNNPDALIVIKSTILFQNIEAYLTSFKIVYNPEFLNQNSSFKDSEKQKHVVLGARIDHSNAVENFYQTQTVIDAEYEYMSIKEAIEFKYVRNIYGAYKVLFWNWVQEMTNNSRKHASLYEKFPQGEMSNICADGQSGYGGACFPKDVQAWGEQFPHELTNFLSDYNERVRSPLPNKTSKNSLELH